MSDFSTFSQITYQEDAMSDEFDKEDSETSCPDGEGDEMKRDKRKV